MERLEGKRVRWLAWDYQVMRGSELVTSIDVAAVRSRSEFELAGERYALRPEGTLSGSYVLELAGRTVARAERERILPVQYRITAGDRQLYLKPRLPTMTYLVQHGDRTIGQVKRRGLFFRAFAAEFQEPLPLATEIFVIALVLLRWRRRMRASSG